MQIKILPIINRVVFFAVLASIAVACKKEAYRPGIAPGTRFPKLIVNGFSLDSVQVRIGPKSIAAGYLFEDISANAFVVPFDSTQTLSRIVMYKKDGSTPYQGSQINFKNKYRDTTLNVFFDGKTIEYNPVLKKPMTGKMGLRINFRSIASNYRGAVDIAIYERYADSEGNTLIKSEAQVIKNVKRDEFSPYVEINGPTTDSFLDYIFYVRMAGTNNAINYPNGVTVIPFETFPFQPDYTSLLTINDIRLVTENPNRIIYSVTDRATAFPQEQ